MSMTDHMDFCVASHAAEERAFRAAGWETLDCSRPFYRHPATEPEGTVRTVAQTAHEDPDVASQFCWWQKDGDVLPPEGAADHRSVYVVRGGEWAHVPV